MPYRTQHVRAGQLAKDAVVEIGGVGFVVFEIGYSENGEVILHLYRNLDRLTRVKLILPVYVTLKVATTD